MAKSTRAPSRVVVPGCCGSKAQEVEEAPPRRLYWTEHSHPASP